MMKRIFTLLILTLATVGCFAQNWRSALYPENWTPDFKDSQGRFLHDFSYAGYHSGLREIPKVKTNIVDITFEPYNADSRGKKDITEVLQQAILDVEKAGGGVVYIPAGEYLMSVKEENKEGVRIRGNNVVIRGAGANKTFIKNTTTEMRSKSLFLFTKYGNWTDAKSKVVKIAKDIAAPSTQIPVADVSPFKVGDIVILATDCTDGFIAEHKAEGLWFSNMPGVQFCRIVVKIDKADNVIEVDAPTRYFMKTRDNARVYKIDNQVEECGIENLSIGNIQNPSNDNWKDEWLYSKAGTGPWHVDGSHLIHFRSALNCWVRGVNTYKPKENKDEVHVLSNCLLLEWSRFVTVEKCDFRHTQYEGAGGNGYLYTLQGNDCLVKDCHAENARHHYDFKRMSANGNVILNCSSKEPYLSSDFHMWLSMANLIDGFKSQGDHIDMNFRPFGDGGGYHGYTTTESVVWNAKSLSPVTNGKQLVVSRQWGYGYVIGTSGVETKVVTTPVSGDVTTRGKVYQYDTAPEDFVEGVGKGKTLAPQSLYYDQLEKRKERMKAQKIKYTSPRL